ncbi:TPA: four-helix bundle copper-binding protein, partial [Burkholderia vietnamiensis]|nr:four-helix bundle copper-binding protein [Burkholderia vietnamiensis]
CAQACDACAAECGRHAHEHCRRCAQACEACAAMCRAMA